MLEKLKIYKNLINFAQFCKFAHTTKRTNKPNANNSKVNDKRNYIKYN